MDNSVELSDLARFRRLGQDLGEFLLVYKFALDELGTKINILREELTFRRGASPIEHVGERLKSVDSIVAKLQRRGLEANLDEVRQHVRDIAGVRIVCSFISDAYEIMEMLTSQRDVHVIEVEDYIAEPKANGYRSLHLIVEIPVFLSDRVVSTPVEVQIRTVAMDFWASTEHKIHYKYDRAVPAGLVDELHAAAQAARQLDETMQRLHLEVRGPARSDRIRRA